MPLMCDSRKKQMAMYLRETKRDKSVTNVYLRRFFDSAWPYQYGFSFIRLYYGGIYIFLSIIKQLQM